jgi:hypothetical protein
MGFATALLSGLAYALLAEEIRPLLPMVSSENFVIGIVARVTPPARRRPSSLNQAPEGESRSV